MRLRQHLAAVGLASVGMLALAGCSGNALASSCQDYADFEQEHGPHMQDITSVNTAQSDEAEIQRLDEVLDKAATDYRAMVDNAGDEVFVAEAEKTLPMFELIDVLMDPNTSDEEKFEASQSPDFTAAIEAERNIVQMCNEEMS